MEDKTSASTKLLPPSNEVKVHPERWLMLLLFGLCMANTTFNWMGFTGIKTVTSYYQMRSTSFLMYHSATSVPFVVFVLPAMYLLYSKGLRVTIVTGTFLMACGSWVRLLSVSRDRFIVLVISQFLEGVAASFFYVVPARLAAVWFGANQVSTACGIGLMFAQVGKLLASIIPSLVVYDTDEIAYYRFENSMQTLHYGTAIVSTVLLLLTFLFIKGEPRHPASNARYLAIKEGQHGCIGSILRNKNFWFLLVAFFVAQGVDRALVRVFITIERYRQYHTVWIVTFGANAAGAIFSGIWLDKAHRFKGTHCSVYCALCLGTTAFVLSMLFMAINELMYTTYGFTQFFTGFYLTLAFEYGVEMTYPDPEGTTCGFIAMAYVLSQFVFAYVIPYFLGPVIFMFDLGLCVLMVICFFMTLFIRGKYRRLAANSTLE